jgi:hypothetical protein
MSSPEPLINQERKPGKAGNLTRVADTKYIMKRQLKFSRYCNSRLSFIPAIEDLRVFVKAAIHAYRYSASNRSIYCGRRDLIMLNLCINNKSYHAGPDDADA